MKPTTVIDNIMLFVECAFLVYCIVRIILEPSIIYVILILVFGVALYLNLSRRGLLLRKKDKYDDKERPDE